MVENLEKLIQGINSIISRNRNSLSEEDINLLKECLDVLDSHKNEKGTISIEVITEVIKLLGAFFSMMDKF